MKIALVKQDIYQDLYVSAPKADPWERLSSTLMRTGPLGLFTDLDTEFYIVREHFSRECQIYHRLHDPGKDLRRELKTLPANQIRAREFRFLNPLSNHSHADFAIDVQEVDWDRFDVVISINISIPTSIVKKHPQVLWAYMMGEAGWQRPQVDFGYDVALTQEVTGRVTPGLGNIDFPYTFVSSTGLETLLNKTGPHPAAQKAGIYAEVNCTTERPVVHVPQLEPFRRQGHVIQVHSQNILENLSRVKNSKYFVKWGGRTIRGNSVIEAISCGTLVLMDPKEVVHSQLLPPDAWVRSFDQLEAKITELERDPDQYADLLDRQRRLLDQFVWKAPLISLENAVEAKRRGSLAPQPTFVMRVKQRLGWVRRLRSRLRDWIS